MRNLSANELRRVSGVRKSLLASSASISLACGMALAQPAIQTQNSDYLGVPNPGHSIPPGQTPVAKVKKGPPVPTADRVTTNVQSPVAPPATSNIQSAAGSGTTVNEMVAGEFIITTTELNAAGTTAFNRFSEFTLANGDSADLYLPGTATTLLNIVRDSRIFIDGTLTSILSDGTGDLGGHLIFASPDGVIVGANGILNVGALTLVTPTTDYLDANFTAGSITSGAINDLARGTVPLTDSGLIQVTGTIYAPDGVVLAAPEISIFDGAALWSGSQLFDPSSGDFGNAAFEATVQTAGGLSVGTALVENNGAIEIVAASDESFTGNVQSLVTGERPVSESVISIDGDIWGDGINVTATAKASSAFDQSAANLLPGVNLADFPFAAGVVEATAIADIVIGENANLQSTTDVDISASTEAEAALMTANSNSDLPFSIGVSVADLVASAEVVIQAGASVMAEDNLSVSAKNNTKLDNNASSAGSTIPITAAFSFANVDAAAVIESGAIIDADTVNVTALNQNEFKTSAEAETGDDGTAAIAFAFADTESDALAFVGADIGADGSPISAVTVEATSITTENRISASSTQMSAPNAMGTDMDAGSEAALTQEVANMSDMAAGMSDSAANQLEGVSGTNLKVGATTTINFSSQNSRAVIEGGTYASAGNGTDVGTITTDPANAPMIYADDVAIYSETLDDLIRNFAVSDGSAESEESGSGSSVVISAAIALGFYDYTTESEVGEETEITAERVGVGAFSAKKFGFTLIDSLTPDGSVDGIYTYLEDLSNRLSASDFGLAEDLFSSYAAASSSASGGSNDVAIAGNISYQEIDQDTRAWVDSGARITATGSTAGQAFTTDLSSIDDSMDGETARSFDWWLPGSGEDQPGVIITAKSMTEGVHVAGALNFTGASLSSDGTAIGGSVNVIQQETSTVAGVADGAVITTDRALTVSAETNNFLIGITPTSGEGSGVTGVGLINVINIENKTSASISNLARIEALGVNLDAQQHVTAWSVAAAKASGEGASIGIAGAVNIISTDTQAFIGDNTAFDNDPGTPSAPEGPFPGDNNLPNSKVITQNLRVRARTSGEAGTLSVAGSQSSRNTMMGSGGGMMDIERNTMSSDNTMGLVDNLEATEGRSQSSVDSSDPNERDATGVLDDATGNLTDQSGDPGLSSGGGGSQQPKFGFAISGSASVSLNELVTKAFVNDANITGVTGAAPTELLVEAVTDTDQISLSGAAALSQSSGSSASGAISGAVAYQVSENQNDAGIYDSVIVDMNDVDVRALTGGLKVGAALGLSAQTGSSQNSAAVAGSFSIARVADSSDARITGSDFTLTDSSAQSDMVNVDAYNRNTIGIGAGSVAYGGRASAAGGLTYAEIDNRVDDAADGAGLAAYAGILDTDITDYDDVSVAAINAAQTIGVGVVGSATSQNFAIAGAVVINRIDADALARIGEGSVITVDNDLIVVAGGGEIAAFDAIIAGDRVAEANEYNVGVNDLVFDSNGDTPDSFGTGARAFALAGAVSVGKTSAGFAISINDIDSDRTAIIDGDTTSVTAGNDVDVIADNESEILALSIATAAGTQSGAFTGSLTVNFIDDDTIARIGDVVDSGMMQTTVSGATVDVVARGNAQINSLAGGISLSAGNAAIGASVSVNEIGGSIDAGIIDTEINDATGLNVVATTSDPSAPNDPGAEINSIAIAGGVSSGGLALSGSATANLIETNVMARIENSTTDNETGLFANVAADRYARIQSIAGALGASGGSGVGIGVAVNRIKGTVSSHVTGGNLKLNTLTVGSMARDVIRTIGVGLGGGGSIGAAGSVVVNIMGTDVTSRIDGGAIVIARNNVGVNALADSEIEALAGAAAFGGSGGVGVASAVNVIEGDTIAEVSGASTQVTAKALDPAQTLTVRDGTLLNPLTFNEVTIPVVDVTIRAKSGAAFDENTKQVRGLSVNSTALRETDVIATAVSIGGYVGAALNAGINVVSGSTKALITDATINPASQGDAKARAGDVDVKASTHVYGGAYSIGVAGGAVGAAGAGIADSYETETMAVVDGANITADDVLINATGSYTTANVIAAAGAGIGGVAAGGIVTIFDATTVGQLIGGTTTSNSLLVNADMDAFVGGFSLVLAGGGIAAAGTFNVLVNESDTEALIGRRNTSTEPAEATTVNSEDVDVTADTTTIVDTTGAAGAGGGGVGIAGTASVIVSETNTRARIENATLTGNGAGSSTNVQATDNFTTDASTASASVGGVGAGGASVNVVVAKSRTNASVDNSTVTTGTLLVDADGVTDIDTNTYALAAGGSVGISGAISVIKLGGNLDAEASDEVSKTLQTAEDTAAESSATDDNRVLSAGERMMVAGDGTYNVDGEALNQDTHLVAANVTGSTVNATTVSVTSDAMTGTHAMLGGAALGGIAGIGAAIGFTTIDTGVSSGIDSGSTINAAGAVTVTAQAADNGRDAGEIDSIVGAAGLGVGLGAAVANVEVTSDVLANVSGRINGSNGGALTVTARDTTNADADASGVSLGLLGAAGVVVARAEKIGSATATIGHATNDITGMLGADVTAESAGGARAVAEGASGGIGISVQGTVATASESTAVTASVRDAATIELAGKLNVRARSTPSVYADAQGVAVAGGAGVGVSLATARIGSASTPSVVQASIGNNVNLANVAGGVNVSSAMLISGRSTDARATGSAGGLLLGAQASEAVAETNANVSALVGDGVSLPAGGLAVTANRATDQYSSASGKSIGFVSVGAANSFVRNSGTTTASVGDNYSAPNGSLSQFLVSASGTDTVESISESGSGGVIAGSATEAVVSSNTISKAEVGANGGVGFSADDARIQANNTTNYRDRADASSAGLAGKSGAKALATISNQAIVDIADNFKILTGRLTLLSDSKVNRLGDSISVLGGAGGLAGIGAAFGSVNITQVSDIIVGDNADIRTQSDLFPGGENAVGAGEVRIDASSSTNVDDTVVQRASGGLALPTAQMVFAANIADRVTIGNDSLIDAEEGIYIGTAPGTDIKARAVAKSSAGISKTSADATGTGPVTAGGNSGNITIDQAINIGDRTRLTADDDIRLNTGGAGFSGSPSNIDIAVTSDSFNSALIPFSTTASATLNFKNDAEINLGTGSVVESIRDVLINASRGNIDLFAESVATFKVNLLLTSFTQTDRGGVVNDSGLGTAVLNGDVTAGRLAYRRFTITSPTDVTASNGLEDLAHVQTGKTLDAVGELKRRKAELEAIGTPEALSQIPILDTVIDFLRGANPVDVDPTNSQNNFYGGTDPAPNVPSNNNPNTELNDSDNPPPRTVVYISGVTAASGNVEIDADVIQGSGNLAANAAPVIEITNNTDTDLEIGDLEIINTSVGEVRLTGKAQDLSSTGVTITPSAVETGPGTIKILNEVGGSSTSPDLFVTGDLINSVGFIDIDVLEGNFYQTATILAGDLMIDVPNGGYFVISNGLAALGPDPKTRYENFLKLQYLLFQLSGTANTQQNRLDGKVPVLFGTTPIDGTDAGGNTLLNLRTPNDFAEFAAFFLTAGLLTEPSGYSGGTPWNDLSASQKLNELLRRGVLTLLGDGLVPTGSEPVYIAFRDGIYREDGDGGAIYSGEGAVLADFNRGRYSYSQLDPQLDLNNVNSSTHLLTFTSAEVTSLLNTLATFLDNNAEFSNSFIETAGSIDVAGVIGVSAKFIDIGGTVTSGRRNNRSVTISNTRAGDGLGLNSFIAASLQNLGNPQTGTIAIDDYLSGPANDPFGKISAVYDIGTGQIVIDNVDASGGGTIILNGQILNSTDEGQLKVRNGRGKIDITNNSNFGITVNNLNAGSNASGRIQITDQAKQDAFGRPLTTLYVQEAGQATQVFTTRTVTDPSSFQIASGINASTYNPRDGIAVQYFEEWLLRRDTNITFIDEDANLISGFTLSPWAWDNDPALQGSRVTIIPQSEYLRQEISVDLESTYQVRIFGDNDTTLYRTFTPTVYRFTRTQTAKADNPIDILFEGDPLGRINITSNGTVGVAGSLNNPTGDVSINSLAGSILQQGSGRIVGTNIDLDALGLIGDEGNLLSLSVSDGGSVSANGGEVGLDIFSSGTVTLQDIQSSVGDILIDANTTDLLVNSVVGNAARNANLSTGNVTLINSGNIFQTGTAAAVVSGRDISLTSLGGQIGRSFLDPFRIDSGLGNELSTTVAVDATADGNIFIEETAGNLRVSNVTSETGSITLMSDGDITNAFTSAEVNEKQVERLNAAIDALLLETDDGSDNVLAFENKVAAQYKTIATILQNATVTMAGGSITSSDTITLSDAQVEAFASQYAAEQFIMGLIAEQPETRAEIAQFASDNAAEIRAYVQAEYTEAATFLTSGLADLGSLTDQNGDPLFADGTSLNASASLSFEVTLVTTMPGTAPSVETRTLSLAELLALDLNENTSFQTIVASVAGMSDLRAFLVDGVTFNDAQLANQLPSSVAAALLEGFEPGVDLIELTSTRVFDLAPSITALNGSVTLVTGGAVGNTLDPVVIEFDPTMPQVLDPVVRALLASTTPGDVAVETFNDNGTDKIRLTLLPTNPLVVDGIDVSANASGDVFVGSLGSLTLRELLTNGGNARIFGQGGVFAADSLPEDVAAIRVNDLLIEAANGSIGTAAEPLNIDLSGNLTRASSDLGIFLRDLNGNFDIGNLFSNGDIHLYAPNGGLLSIFGNDDLHIKGDSIRFEARDDIGAESTALGVEVSDTGSLIAISEQGGVNLRSPRNALSAEQVTAPGDVDIVSAGDLTILDQVSAGGQLFLGATTGDVVGTAGSTVESTAGSGTISGEEILFDPSSVLSIFSDLTLTSTMGQILLGQVTTGGTLSGNSATSTTLQSDVTAGGNTVFTAGTIFEIDPAVNVSSGGLFSASGEGILIEDDAMLMAQDQLDLVATAGDVTLGENVVVQSKAGSSQISGDNLTFAQTSLVDIFSDLVLNANAGSSVFGQLTMGGMLTSTSAMSTTLSNDVTTGGNASFTAGGELTVNPAVNVTVGGDADAQAAGILFGDDSMLMAMGDVTFDATTGDVQLGEDVLIQSKAGSGTISGENLIFAQSSFLDISDDLDLQSTSGQTILGQATVGGVLISGSATDTLLTNLVMVGGNSSFTAGSSFTMQPGISLLSDTGQINVEAASIMMGQGSQMTAAGPIALTSLLGDVVISQLTSNFDGDGAIDIMSAGSILPVIPGETNLVATAPGALVRLMGENDIGSIDADRPIVVDITSLEAVSNNGDINIVGLSDLNAPLISALNGAIKLRINGSLTFGEILGEPDIAIMGSLTGDRMVFRNGVLVASEGINIGLLEVGESLTLRGIDITANILHTEATDDPLNLILTGFDEDSEASTVLLDIDAPLGLLSPRYYATNSVITTTADRVQIEDGLISGDLILRTPSVDLVLDNASQVPRNMFDIQLYNTQPRFFLMQDGFSTITDQFILFYLPGILDTQETPLAFDAISIRRNQQLAPGSAIWGDSFRPLLRLRDEPRSEEEKARDTATSKPVTVPDDGYSVNVSAEFHMAD